MYVILGWAAFAIFTIWWYGVVTAKDAWTVTVSFTEAFLNLVGVGFNIDLLKSASLRGSDSDVAGVVGAVAGVVFSLGVWVGIIVFAYGTIRAAL